MLRRNYLIGVVIFGFWAVMTMLLLQREVLLPRISAPSGTGVPGSLREPTDAWMGIYMRDDAGGENRVGYVHLRSQPGRQDGDTGVRHGMTVKLATKMLSVPTELLMDGTAWVSDTKGLRDFEFRMNSFDEHVVTASGIAEKNKLNLNVQTAGENYPLAIPMNTDLLVQPNFGAVPLNLPTLEIGDEVYVDAFDPVTMSSGTARIRCVGTETMELDGEQVATKILETELGGVTTKTWVTLDEEIMRVETPLGIVLKRITQREALAELKPGEEKEIIHSAAIRPSGPKPFRGAAELRFVVRDLPSQAMLPEDELQQRVGEDEYLIRRATPPEGGAPVGHEDLAEYLEGDPFVQTTNARISALAQELVGTANTPWDKAQRIHQWVYTNIDKSPVLSIPSALDVLKTKEGDCNEHTVLFTALARAAGVPTRMALGLVWSDELDGFYYHAWPEVYDGHWVPMDPTLGQLIADATHIKLLEGSIEQWPRLTPYLGQLDIEVVEVR